MGIRSLATEDYEALVSLWQRAGLKFNPERLSAITRDKGG